MIEFRNVTYSVQAANMAAEPSAQESKNKDAQEASPEEVIQPGTLWKRSAGPRLHHKIAASARRRFLRKRGRNLILDDVSFFIPARSISCIMGVSGTGKTTLLRLMAGLLQPDSGEILIDGQNVVGLNEREMNEVRRSMGFVFQYGALFDSLTVGENVGFGLEQMGRPKSEIAEIVVARLKDVGLPEEGVQNKLPSEISGGMRKRVAMARALATSPKILLYDEPTSGLDPVMARIIDDLIVKSRDQVGTTNVVVSHHLPSILRISDRVLMLHDAHLEAEGPPDEVKKSGSEVVRQFLEGRADGPITVA